MARILIGWELGAGAGHSSRLLDLADILARRGHEPLFATQQIGPFAALYPTWQAPVWPRLLGPLSRRYPRPPATMGDMLAYLGLDDAEATTAMLLAWDRVVADTRPDAVVAEYAPMLQLAVRGRVPCLAWGTGFSLPPDHLPSFPSFTPGAAVMPEGELLSSLNESLEGSGRKALAALPEIFAADASLVASFRELDPYRQWRRDAPGVPAIIGSVPPAADEASELFVYFNTAAPRPDWLLRGILQARLPTRIHDPAMTDADAEAAERLGLRVERRPVAFADIAARSRLVLFHGGLGFASSALLAGIAQVIVPLDHEKRLTAEALVGMGLCRTAGGQAMGASELAGLLQSAWSDDALQARARESSPEFRSRMTASAEFEAANLVERLI